MYSLQGRILTRFCFFKSIRWTIIDSYKVIGKKDHSALFIWCNKFFAKAFFLFLFKWNFLLPKWNSLKPLLSIKLISFCAQKIFKQAFVSVKVFWMLVLSLRLIMDENAMDVDGDSLKTLLNFIFLTLVKNVTLLVITLVPSWTMRSPAFSLIMSSSFHPFCACSIGCASKIPRPKSRAPRKKFVLVPFLFC